MTSRDPRGLAGKVAVIAGGATGIGAATAARLGSEGARVVVGDIAEDAAEATAEAIRAAGGTAIAHAFDLADPESVRALIDSAVAGFGAVDLLFNVGSDMSLLRSDTDVMEIEFDVWDRTMTVTLRGYLASMKYALPLMLSRGGGAIVNMSSAAAFIGEPTRPAYATAKAGIGALTRHVASRWGREGIRCNAVAPGFTGTDLMRAAPQWPDLEAAALRGTRSTRVGYPADIAALVTFLMSDDGAWVNGQVINIDGGAVLR